MSKTGPASRSFTGVVRPGVERGWGWVRRDQGGGPCGRAAGRHGLVGTEDLREWRGWLG